MSFKTSHFYNFLTKAFNYLQFRIHNDHNIYVLYTFIINNTVLKYDLKFKQIFKYLDDYKLNHFQYAFKMENNILPANN